jgi:hypothetical protein
MFFLATFIALVAGIYLPAGWRFIALALPLSYVSILILAAGGVAMKSRFLVGAMFPIAAAIMHVAYGAGFVCGVVNGRAKSLVKMRLERRTA